MELKKVGDILEHLKLGTGKIVEIKETDTKTFYVIDFNGKEKHVAAGSHFILNEYPSLRVLNAIRRARKGK